MKLLVVTSLLFLCSSVAAQDLAPVANSLPPASALRDEPATPLSSPSLPSTTLKQENSRPTLQSNVAPSLPMGSAPNPRLVENPLGNSLPPATLGSPLGNAPSGNSLEIRYMKKTPVDYQIARPDRTIETKTRMVYSEVSATIAIPHDDDIKNLDELFKELEGDGKRAAIQAVTTHRHGKLLQALKDAKTEADREQAAKKLEENYRAHYAGETKWRLDRLADLEKRMEEMRTQVKDRAAAEEKFLEAAMTLAKLNAQGIAAEPPQLKASNQSYQGEPLFGTVYDSPMPLNAPPATFNQTAPLRTSPLQ